MSRQEARHSASSFQSYLSDAESVGDYAIHGVGVHLGPLQLEAVDSGSVLPQGAVGIIVELWGVGLTCRRHNTI